MYLDEIQAFVDAVREGRPSPIGGRAGIASLAIAEAILEAGESGATVYGPLEKGWDGRMKDEDLMKIPKERLGEGTNIKVEIVESEIDLYNDMARVMFKAIVAGLEKGRPPVFILPVGPRDQYRRLARLCNVEGVSCRDVVCINMDEYLNRGRH